MRSDTPSLTDILKAIYWDMHKGEYFSALCYSLLDLLPGESGCLIRGRYISGKLASCGSGLYVSRRVVINHALSLHIGRDVMINTQTIIEAGGRVDIGDDVLIGPSVRIWSINHKFDDRCRSIRKQGWDKAPVCIGKDVWIGAGTTVLPGSVIPEGAVIAAGSIVTKASVIEPYSVNGGNPVRVLRMRGERETYGSG